MPCITNGEEKSGPVELYDQDHGSGPQVVVVRAVPPSGSSWDSRFPAVSAAGGAVDRTAVGVT